MATKLISALFMLFFSLLANAEYQPSYSFERYIKTITVHADGTNEVLDEALDKVETEKGIKSASQADLSYIKGMQKIQIVEAYTIKPDGRKVKVTKENIRERDDPTSNGADIFSDTKHKIILYPEVSVGSKLYSKVKTTNFKSLFKNHFI